MSLLMRIRTRVRTVLRRFRETPLEDLPDSPDYFRTFRAWAGDPRLRRVSGGWMYEGEFWPDYLHVGGAAHAIFPVALRYCIGRGIDVGAGYWPFPGAIPVDPFRGKGKEMSVDSFEPGSLDYVFSSHCLEHIENPGDAIRAWRDLIRPGGILFLYLPHERCLIWRPGSPFVKEGHRWSPTYEAVSEMLVSRGMEIIGGDPGPDAMWSFHLVGRVVPSPTSGPS